MTNEKLNEANMLRNKIEEMERHFSMIEKEKEKYIGRKTPIELAIKLREAERNCDLCDLFSDFMPMKDDQIFNLYMMNLKVAINQSKEELEKM